MDLSAPALMLRWPWVSICLAASLMIASSMTPVLPEPVGAATTKLLSV